MELVGPFANAAVFPYLPTKGASTINKTISINGNYQGLKLSSKKCLEKQIKFCSSLLGLRWIPAGTVGLAADGPVRAARAGGDRGGATAHCGED